MQHLEFINHNHFNQNYHRKYATGKLWQYIDFCWETNFDELLQQHPSGFADVLFPNIGYTYLINLGSPFTMQLNTNKFDIKGGGFLPRHQYITCHHRSGNQIFGIKFKICPVLFQKEVNFSEYRAQVFPLAYLIESNLVEQLKKASSFQERVTFVFNHYKNLISEYKNTIGYIAIVADSIDQCINNKLFKLTVEDLAKQHNISKRTLQRYFEITTGFSSKPALQTIRMRQALTHLSTQPHQFNFRDYQYFDYSHFVKHLKHYVGADYLPHFLQFYRNRGTAA